MRSKIYENIGEQVYFDQLPNGLKVFVIKKPEFSKSLAFFATKYGGADRRFRVGGQWTDTPAGVAHFLEHKMFDMEYGDALTKFSKNGASANAFTSGDMTAYHFECTDCFYENLDILLEFVSTPYFSQESVDKEQGIIGQEIRMTEDNPDFVLYYNLLRALYKDNPVRDSVAGTVESIAEITADTLYKCHKVFYSPANMVLCAVGNIDPEKVVKAAERILPKNESVAPERDYGSKETLFPCKNEEKATMEVGLPMFIVGSKVIPEKRGDALLKQGLIADISLEYLFGSSSPFYSKYYAEGLINAEFSAEFENVASAAYTMIGGESKDPYKAKAAIEQEIARVLDTGIDEALFRRLKKAEIGSELRGLNSFDNLCYNLAKGCFDGYDPMLTVEITNSINSEDIFNFIKDNLKPEHFAISVISSAE